MVYPLKLEGLQANNEGLYSFEDIQSRFNRAIREYEEIK